MATVTASTAALPASMEEHGTEAAATAPVSPIRGAGGLRLDRPAGSGDLPAAAGGALLAGLSASGSAVPESEGGQPVSDDELAALADIDLTVCTVVDKDDVACPLPAVAWAGREPRRMCLTHAALRGEGLVAEVDGLDELLELGRSRLERRIADADWRPCDNRPPALFEASTTNAFAAGLCGGCPVQVDCLAAAVLTPQADDYGTRGGLPVRVRKQLRRKLCLVTPDGDPVRAATATGPRRGRQLLSLDPRNVRTRAHSTKSASNGAVA